ncbi:MAG: tRNA lysidine(34) synthetase TilS [Solirubrobacteraceae bacterium]
MLQDIKIHLQNNFPFLTNKKLLLAISGGVDSMVLFDLFYSLDYTIEVAHCNFKLRGNDSEIDKLLVKEKCKQLNIPFHSISFETQKIAAQEKKSIQIIARELRYKWFYELLETLKLDYILTAHHLNDEIETFIFNLSRGTGLKGLTGIPDINNKVVRPLLTYAKSDILYYAKQKKIDWREDVSNEKTIYKRNFIRHKIIPELLLLNTDFLNNFKKSVTILKENNELVEEYIKKIKSEITHKNGALISISIKKLLEQKPLNTIIFNVFSDFGFYSTQEIIKILASETGSTIESKTHILLKNREELLIKEKNKEQNQAIYIIPLEKDDFLIEKPIKLQFEKSKKWVNNFTISLDLEKIKLPLTIRKWQKGDFFYPIGINGKKKVSKFFKDEKLSIFQKNETWLLCDANNSILWIINYRMDERFKLTENTKQFLHIKIC